MPIQNDASKLRAAVEVIMDKIIKNQDWKKFDESQPETFLELLTKELYRLIRLFEKHLWCNDLADQAVALAPKIKSIQLSQDYDELKKLIDDAYDYHQDQDTLWKQLKGFVHDTKEWIFHIWHHKKTANKI